MGRKELKEQNKDLGFHIVDIISKIDPSESGKYTPFLLKLFKKTNDIRMTTKRRIRSRAEVIREVRGEFVQPKGENVLENTLINFLVSVFGVDNLEVLIKFNEHLENHRIDENKRDINQYSNWDELIRIVSTATLKAEEKRLEKEVIKVLETEEWLAVRPLTIESSLTYGAGTKWCTASKANHDYFYRYCSNGVLTYVINKKNGDKYGVMYNIRDREFSVWNAPDKRIDSVESSIPSEIMKEIFEMSKVESPNYSYFSEDEIKRADRYIGELKMAVINNGPVAEMEVPGNWEMGQEEATMDDLDTDLAEETENIPTMMGEMIEVDDEAGDTMEIVWRGEMYNDERVYEAVERPEGNNTNGGI